MAKVALVKCRDYNHEEVCQAVDSIFTTLGGVERFVKPGAKVLIKPNMIMKKRPEEAATTHPLVVKAVADKVAAAGASVLIADSPGGFYTESTLKALYSVCGYEEIVSKGQARLNLDTSTGDIVFENGRVVRKLTLIKPVLEVDLVINLPKLKTHGMMVFTGAVKNLFGLVPGVLKAEFHLRMNSHKVFSDLLVDICEYVKPGLTIMDAVVGMEGDGPTAGNPRSIGVLLGSTNPYALDVAATEIIGLKSEKVFTIARAAERGLVYKMDHVEIAGDRIEDCKVTDFKLPSVFRDITFFRSRLAGFVAERLKPKPVFLYKKCSGCKQCLHHCPSKAIDFTSSRPKVKLNKCIRCFCCQELCPSKAIEIKRHWLIRSLSKDT